MSHRCIYGYVLMPTFPLSSLAAVYCLFRAFSTMAWPWSLSVFSALVKRRASCFLWSRFKASFQTHSPQHCCDQLNIQLLPHLSSAPSLWPGANSLPMNTMMVIWGEYVPGCLWLARCEWAKQIEHWGSVWTPQCGKLKTERLKQQKNTAEAQHFVLI